MSSFNVTFFVHAGTVVRGRTGLYSVLSVEPDDVGGCVVFQIDSRCSPEDRLKVAEKFAAEVTRWRDALAAECEQVRTAVEELAAAQAEIVELKADRLATGEKAAADWNDRHPLGTPVLAYPGTRDDEPLRTVTRSAAWTLGHGEPVVLVEGETGGICLTHVDVIKDGVA